MSTTTTNIGVRIRRAEQDDVPSICALGASTFSATFGYSLPPQDLETYLESTYNVRAITAGLTNPDMTTTVAVDLAHPLQVVGFAQLLRNSSGAEPCLQDADNPVEIYRLYVDPKFHGRKVGSSLMKNLEQIAKDEGFKTIWLGVWEENNVALKFYHRWGYRRVGEHPFKMGDCVQVDWILKKQLN